MTWQMEKLSEVRRRSMHPRAQFRDPAAATGRVWRTTKSVIDRIYTPQAYFGRVTRAAQARLLLAVEEGGQPGWPGALAALLAATEAALVRLLRSVIREQPLLLGHYVRALYACARDNRGALQAVGTMAAFYLHLGPFSRVVSQAMARQIEEIDSGGWTSPAASITPKMGGAEFLERLQDGALRSRSGRSAHV